MLRERNEAAVAELQRELQIHAKIGNNPNVVELYGMFRDHDGQLCVVMKLMKGSESVLCCAVLCCAVLCCAVLCCAVLCCAVLCCAALCCAVLFCSVLCCVSAG
jgi:serine/threonine protein kinase